MKTLKIGSIKIKVNAKGKALKTETLKKGTWARIDGEYKELKENTTREVNAYCMPFQSRNQVFKTAKNSFDPLEFQAHSYGHWCYVKKIKGKVVFNAYRYSVTTSGHQSEMRALLRELGIKIDLEVNMHNSLSHFKECALEPMYRAMFELEVALKRPNSKPATNKERRASVAGLKRDITKARALGAVLTKEKIKALQAKVLNEETERLASLKSKREERAALIKARRDIVATGETFQLAAS